MLIQRGAEAAIQGGEGIEARAGRGGAGDESWGEKGGYLRQEARLRGASGTPCVEGAWWEEGPGGRRGLVGREGGGGGALTPRPPVDFPLPPVTGPGRQVMCRDHTGV